MLSQLHSCSVHFKQKAVLLFCLLFSFFSLTAQDNNVNTNSSNKPMNPLLYAAFKKPVKANPLLQEYIKPSRYELMYWPNYPLTAEQIAARDRRYEQSLGQQIVGDIVGSAIDALIYGSKKPVAARPRF